MVVDQGLTISQVCKDLAIGHSAFTGWAKHYRAKMSSLPSVGHPITPEQQCIRELEIENRVNRENDDILEGIKVM